MTLYHTPLLHPRLIAQGQWAKEPAQKRYLERFVEGARAGTLASSLVDTNQPPPGAILRPTLTDLDTWLTEVRAEGYDALSHDLENAGRYIICDGITPLHLASGRVGRTLCLRFRGRGGKRYWSSWSDHRASVCWLGGVLRDSSLASVFHNGVGHDIRILEAHGFIVAGDIYDTMIMQFTAYSELQKGLAYCATLYNWTPFWKGMLDLEDEEDGK